MGKHEVLTEIQQMRTDIGGWMFFAGQTKIKDEVQKHYNFLATHKSDASLERLILKECSKLFKEAKDLYESKVTRLKAME